MVRDRFSAVIGHLCQLYCAMTVIVENYAEPTLDKVQSIIQYLPFQYSTLLIFDSCMCHMLLLLLALRRIHTVIKTAPYTKKYVRR